MMDQKQLQREMILLLKNGKHQPVIISVPLRRTALYQIQLPCQRMGVSWRLQGTTKSLFTITTLLTFYRQLMRIQAKSLR